MIRLSVLAALPELLRDMGHDPVAIVAHAGLNISLFENPDTKIPFTCLGQLLAYCAQVTNCSQIGLQLGSRITPSMLGIGGFVVQHADKVETALEDLIRYLALHDQGGVATLVNEGGTSLFGYSVYDDSVVKKEAILDAALAIAKNIMQALCGPEWRPREVLFTRHKSGDLALYESFFKAPVRFNAPYNGLVFSTQWLKHTPPRADPIIYKYLRQQADEQQSAADQDLVSGLRPLLRVLLLSQRCTMAEAARQLGLHRRTLARRLQAEGTTFREEIASARWSLARQLLEESQMPIAGVAEVLGYTDTSAFTHAFKRWAGMAPGQWQEACQINPRFT